MAMNQSLREVQEEWSLMDLMDALEVLEIKSQIEKIAVEENTNES